MSVVICKLPKAGLGNQLFPLMNAFLFGHIHHLPVLVTNYRQLKIGPWLRNEKSKRNYKGSFLFEKTPVNAFLESFTTKSLMNSNVVREPQIDREEIFSNDDKTYIFSDIPHWDNFFKDLKENRELVLELFWRNLNPLLKERLDNLSYPSIGIHIRMGDFRKLKENEDFKKVGAVRTPENYFITVVNKIREIAGTCLPVSVFTDGYKKEFTQLFSLENIEMIEGNNDMLDMLLLSKSQVIVTSAGSTFSYWSAFLSDAIVIMHPDHIHQSIRPADCDLFEGPFDEENEKLTQLLGRIEYDKKKPRFN